METTTCDSVSTCRAGRTPESTLTEGFCGRKKNPDPDSTLSWATTEVASGGRHVEAEPFHPEAVARGRARRDQHRNDARVGIDFLDGHPRQAGHPTLHGDGQAEVDQQDPVGARGAIGHEKQDVPGPGRAIVFGRLQDAGPTVATRRAWASSEGCRKATQRPKPKISRIQGIRFRFSYLNMASLYHLRGDGIGRGRFHADKGTVRFSGLVGATLGDRFVSLPHGGGMCGAAPGTHLSPSIGLGNTAVAMPLPSGVSGIDLAARRALL